MYDGSITSNTATSVTGAGSVMLGTADAKFYMHGGSISENYGAGITAWAGTATLTNGIIAMNEPESPGQSAGGVFIMSGGTFIMEGGQISDNTNHIGAGVNMHSGTFIMSGGTISNNIGGGVAIGNLGAFYMTHNDARIENNTTFSPLANGGGIHVNLGTVNITGGVIANNSARRGGGIYLSSSINMLTITGGYIKNNVATYDGGGIFTWRRNNSTILPATAYSDIDIGEAVVFSGNRAGNGASAPPDNRLPHIAATTASIWGNPLNNYDINYTGRLGYEYGLSS